MSAGVTGPRPAPQPSDHDRTTPHAATPRHRREDDDPLTIPLQLPHQRAAGHPSGPLPAAPPAALPPAPPFGTQPAGHGTRPWPARRWLLVAAVVVVLVLITAAGGLFWWWHTTSTSPAGTHAASAPASPAAPAPGTGANLTDVSGAALSPAAAAGARQIYTALVGDDTTTLARLYHPGHGAAAWSTVAGRLSHPAIRDGLLAALRTPAIRPAEVAYLYTSDNYGVGLRADGTVAFYGTGQAGPSGRPASSAGSANPGNATTAGPVPTLGAAGWRPGTEGYGQVRPTVANADGDGTSVVDNLHWRSWGGPTATGTGTAAWVPPGAASSDAIETPAVVVASDLGDCRGHLGYRKIGWYFPSRGEGPAVAQNGYPDICTPM